MLTYAFAVLAAGLFGVLFLNYRSAGGGLPRPASLVSSLLLLMASLATPLASRAETPDSINLALGGLNPMPHCNATVYVLEYEHSLTPATAILARGSGVDYRFNNGHYLEDGMLRGMDIGARYYHAGDRQGGFMGVSLGRWSGDRTFVQNQNTTAQWEGSARSNSVRLNFELGNRIPIHGTDISIMPEVNFGKFFSSYTCEATAPSALSGTPCIQKSEVNGYLFFGVAVGYAF